MDDEFNENDGGFEESPEVDDSSVELDSTDEVPEESDSTDEVPEESDSTDEVPEESDKTDEVPEESDSADEVPEESDSTDEVPEESDSTDEVPEESDSTDEKLSDAELIQRKRGISQDADPIPDGESPQDADDWNSLSDREKINRLRGIDDNTESEHELTEKWGGNIAPKESYDGGDGKAAVTDDKPETENNEEFDQVDANDDYDDHRYGMREGEDMYGDDKSYGNSGDPTRDSLDANATYEDSHNEKTDYFYKDEQAEETERANLEGKANLKRQNEIDEERYEEEEREEQKAQQRQEEELAEQQRQEEETKEQQERSLQDIIREKRGISSNSDSTSVEKRNINPYMRYRGRDGR